MVQTGYTDNPTIRDPTAEQRIQIFAAQTGGTVYIPSTTSDLDQAFVQIAADLAQQYVLTYYASNDVNDGRFRAISLRVMTRPNMRVRARRVITHSSSESTRQRQERQPGKLLVRLLTHRQ
jgi:hypothetical protein